MSVLRLSTSLVIAALLSLSGVGGAHASTEVGTVSYYGESLAGHRTASGETFDPAMLTMAHRTLPLGTRVQVTDMATRRSVVVRVNDRGPFSHRRVGDLSLAAARALRMVRRGAIRAELRVVNKD